MAQFPAHTSFYSFNTFLSEDMMYQVSIALDIINKYYKSLEQSGKNTRTHIIEGYGEMISFEEICLGAWMVFDKLYGEFPPLGYIPKNDKYVGWTGFVINPSVDIPIALQMFKDLNAAKVSYSDKYQRNETIKLWFQCPGYSFIGHDDYNNLKDINKEFYEWILRQIDEVETLIKNYENIDLNYAERTHLFDLRTKVKWYDKKYTVGKDDENFLHSVYLAGALLYGKFLTSLEQILFQYTHRQFPLKLYGIISYMYHFYLKYIASFFKPYHATLLEIIPKLKLGPESATIADLMYKTIIKRLYDTTTFRAFDLDETLEPYDSQYKVRELISYKMTKVLHERIINTSFFDTYNEYEKTDQIDTCNIYEEVRIMGDLKKEYIFDGSSLLSWYDWGNLDPIKSNILIKNSGYHPVNKTITNVLDRDLILIYKFPIHVDELKNIEVLDVECTTKVRFAFNFVDGGIENPNRYLKWVSYKAGVWNQIFIPNRYDATISGYRGTNPGETLVYTPMMKPSDVLTVNSIPYNNSKIINVAIGLPIGETFTSLKIKVTQYTNIINHYY